jgi:hypothetical protein
MYIYKEDAVNFLDGLNDRLAKDFYEVHEILYRLLKDDDWSLVIKSHAMLEAIVTNLIIAKTKEAQLKSIVERLPLHDSQIGKLAITKQYGLLTNGQLRFIRRASELRNELVHKLENIDFRFENYVASMDGNQRKAWSESLTWHSLGTEAAEAWAKAAVDNTKVAFWFSIFMLVTIVVLDSESLKMQEELDLMIKRATRELLQANEKPDVLST